MRAGFGAGPRARHGAAWLAIGSAVAVAAGCAHQAPPPSGDGPGLERSVFPLFVSAGTPGTRGRFRACSAVYVAPHVLATSVAAFPADDAGRRVVDLSGTTVLDGDYPLTLEGVAFPVEAPDLVLLRTKEAGAPLRLRRGPVRAREAFLRVGHAFSRSPRRGYYPQADWSVAGAEAVEGAEALEPLAFSARTELQAGLCGAPLVDAGGQLAGLVRAGADGTVSVVAAHAIRSVLHEAVP